MAAAIRFRFRLLVSLLSLVISLQNGCVSGGEHVGAGIQPGFQAVNLGRILFLPVIAQPDPGRRSASVDSAALSLGQVPEVMEKVVLASFKDQPNVNGLSPSAVRAGTAQNPEILNNLSAYLVDVAKRLYTPEVYSKNAVSRDCALRKNYLDFYVYCVADNAVWKDYLNRLSGKLYNADSALFVVITDLNRKQIEKKYIIETEVAVILVDTNNGHMIWGRQVKDSLANDPLQYTFPQWSDLFSKMFAESFWRDFPGRVQKL